MSESKIKDLSGYISWVDSIPTEQGAEFLHKASIPMVQELKSSLSGFLDQPLEKDELIEKVGEYLETIETDLPGKHYQKAIE